MSRRADGDLVEGALVAEGDFAGGVDAVVADSAVDDVLIGSLWQRVLSETVTTEYTNLELAAAAEPYPK